MLCSYLQLIFIISLSLGAYVQKQTSLLVQIHKWTKRQKGGSTFALSSDLCLKKNPITS